MFTGIIQELGTIRSISKRNNSIALTISAKKTLEDLYIGGTIAINGVSQSIIIFQKNNFTVEIVEEILKTTNLGQLQISSYVNLERSLRFSDRLDGHLVTGNIDCFGNILAIVNYNGNKHFTIEIPNKFAKYLIHKGSITIDGVSLTIDDIKDNDFTVSAIPHILKNTILGIREVGRPTR